MMPISKLSATSHVLAYSDFWEEKAFAEDSAAHLGGCIWPPRSYSCSFCGREFRSAQALGGHMNVHRRERARARARLEESTNQRQKPSPPVLRQYPSQVCTLVYNSNPNFVDATLPPPGVLLPSTQDDCGEQSFPFISSIIQEQPKGSSQSLGSSNSNIEREDFGVGEMGYCCVPREVPKPNFALSSSDSFTHGSRMLDSGGEEEEAISSKRQKKGSSSPLLIQGERGGTFTLFPFFMTSGLGERRIRSSGVLGLGADSNEDLDLELRLGNRPKVK